MAKAHHFLRLASARKARIGDRRTIERTNMQLAGGMSELGFDAVALTPEKIVMERHYWQTFRRA